MNRLAAFLLLPCLSIAQTPSPTTTTISSITANGEATVEAKADQAEVMVGLTSTAKTAKEAAAQNATRSEAIIQKLKSAFAKQIDVETVSYSVNPEYRPPRPGDERAPEISG